MKVKDVVVALEEKAPLALQESYDNSGLSLGDKNTDLTGVLCCIDITLEVLEEAIQNGCNMIVSHHPLIFSPLKSLTGKTEIERIILKAIENKIALYSAHTNLDNWNKGVNYKIAEKLGLVNASILSPLKEKLVKLVTFVPKVNADEVRGAIFNAGAGHIGNYDCCSYNLTGKGTFRAGENTNPHVGEKGTIHKEEEIRIETVLPSFIQSKVVRAMITAHPYEEVAYDVYPLKNDWKTSGAGLIGELEEEISKEDILALCKSTFKANGIRYTKGKTNKVKKIALCGGSGSFLIPHAIRNKAEVFITGDIKYHQFLDFGKDIILCDIGHYESEQFTTEIFHDIISKKITTFAVRFSEVVTNPIKYY